MATDYTALSLADVRAELQAIASDAQSVFGNFDEARLNWRPDAARWSVAQCFDHLLNANREMFRSIDAATDAASSRTVWQRLPILPGVFGRMLIKSQAPDSRRKFTAPRRATPASSAIDPHIIDRFVAHQREAAARVQALDGRDVGRIIGFALCLVHHVQRARWLPAHGGARAPALRAGAARDPGTGIPVVDCSGGPHPPVNTTSRC